VNGNILLINHRENDHVSISSKILKKCRLCRVSLVCQIFVVFCYCYLFWKFYICIVLYCNWIWTLSIQFLSVLIYKLCFFNCVVCHCQAYVFVFILFCIRRIEDESRNQINRKKRTINNTKWCDLDTQECDFNTNECDLTSMI
jgi:hypothetical protein